MADDRVPGSGVPAGPGSAAGAAAGPVEAAPAADAVAVSTRPGLPVSGTRWAGTHWAGRVGVVVLAAAVLFVCYWRQSLTQPVSSDGAANAMQAWDMLH